MSYLGRSRGEEVLNSLTHLLMIPIIIFLMLQGSEYFVFLAFSLLTFTFSTLYHGARKGAWKDKLRRLDVASIFWLIPASIFLLVPIEIGLALIVLCVLLSLPVILRGVTSIFVDATLITLAIAAGVSAFVFSSEWEFVFAGIVLYGMGLPFYFDESLRGAHTLWHLFVIAGWSTHLWAHVNV